jgi:CBS domain-containing protein
MVTDRDLVVRVIAERPDPNEMRLDEILTKAVETVSPHAEHSNTSRCPRVRRT